MSMSKYLTTQEIADELRVTRTTVYRWIDEGKLAAVRIGGAVRVLRSSYDALISSSSTGQQQQEAR
jgi:excisionase family DNA binding protein